MVWRAQQSGGSNTLCPSSPSFFTTSSSAIVWRAFTSASGAAMLTRRQSKSYICVVSFLNTREACKTIYVGSYRISSNRHPGVYFLRDSADPAFKRGRHLNRAGVYLLCASMMDGTNDYAPTTSPSLSLCSTPKRLSSSSEGSPGRYKTNTLQKLSFCRQALIRHRVAS